MLTRYVRDKNRNPIGVIICTQYGHIGWSLTHKNDRWNKSEGKALAYGRAVLGTDKKVPQSVQYDYNIMEDKMNRYFDGYSKLSLAPFAAGEI